MTRLFLQLSVILIVALQSCGKALEETKLDKYDLTITTPKLKAAPEFTDLKSSETDIEWSRYDFNIGGHARVNIIEIAESAFPADINMLKKVIAESPDFIETIETKQLKNGVFGVIYKMKGSNDKPIKNYLFYLKKGTRFFRMEPVFNSELTDLDLQLAAYESIK